MDKFKLKDKSHKHAGKDFVKVSELNETYCVDPMQVIGKAKLLWEERLEEAKKSNPNCTLEDLQWGIADIPDEFIIKGKNKFTKNG